MQMRTCLNLVPKYFHPLRRGAALHGLHQVRDEVVALLHLHIDVGERLADPLTHGDEAVVDRDDPHDEDDDDAEVIQVCVAMRLVSRGRDDARGVARKGAAPKGEPNALVADGGEVVYGCRSITI